MSYVHRTLTISSNSFPPPYYCNGSSIFLENQIFFYFFTMGENLTRNMEKFLPALLAPVHNNSV